MSAQRGTPTLDARHETARANCVEALTHLSQSGIPFLVGGTLGLRHYTKTARYAKDLDVFVLPEDIHRVLDYFRTRGYATEFPFPHWLGKVYVGDLLMDVIFSSGNGLARVDGGWFHHAEGDELYGVPVRLCPPEEMIWSKAFVQERERFDGADVLHLLHAVGGTLDWSRLLQRFGAHWRVLLAHLILFGYAYTDERDRLPACVFEDLMSRLVNDRAEKEHPVCNGTLLSREQYLDDVQRGEYADGRLAPEGPMTREQIDIWTAAIPAPAAANIAPEP